MSTCNAFYVFADGNFDMLSDMLASQYPRAKIEATATFLSCTLTDDDITVPEAQLQALSATFDNDVIWLSFQSVVDAFEFHHWRSGEHLRSLVHGCVSQGLWERVEGYPEAWEREVFFADDDQEFFFGTLQDDGVDNAEAQRIWDAAEILAGRCVPLVLAKECAIAIAEYYGVLE